MHRTFRSVPATLSSDLGAVLADLIVAVRRPAPTSLEEIYDLGMLATLADETLREHAESSCGRSCRDAGSVQRLLTALHAVRRAALETSGVQLKAWNMCARRYRILRDEDPVDESFALFAVPLSGWRPSTHLEALLVSRTAAVGPTGVLLGVPAWTEAVLADEHPGFVEDVTYMQTLLADVDVREAALELWDPGSLVSDLASLAAATECAAHLLAG